MKLPSIVLASLIICSGPISAQGDPAPNTVTAKRVLLEKMGQGRFEISDEIYDPAFIAHGFGRDYSLAEDNASGQQIRAAFPDLKVSVLRTVEEGDHVAVHWQSEGTNTVKSGPFPGTGRRLVVDGMTFFRFSNGRIAEEWTTYDNLSVMQQLEPAPAASR